jgi:nucleoside-diphosphate-sugar epimerase
MASVSGKRIVITGASGFVGRHLISKCLESGIEVIALSRSGTRLPGVTDARIDDYRDVAGLTTFCRRADAVVHLAARAHQMQESAEGTDSAYEVANVGSAVAVATATRLAGVRRFVFVSSIGVNGNSTNGVPFTLNDEPAPVEAYAKSKWRAEQAVAAELQEGPTDFVVLRPPLVYGAGCPGNFASLLRLVAKAPIIPLGKVSSRRTFIYVGNLVDAILTASTHSAASRRTFLIADAQSLSLSEIVRVLALGLNRPPWVVVNISVGLLELLGRMTGRSNMLRKLTAELIVDASEFGTSTGWVPPFAAAYGLEETARAYRGH